MLICSFACCLVLALPIGCARPARNPVETGTVVETDAANQLLQLGLEFARRNDAVRAEQYLAAAMEHGADPDRALPALIRACVASRRYEAAAQYAEKHLHSVQAERETQMVLVGLLLALDRPKKALPYLERVTRRYPEYPLAHFLLGAVLRDHAHSPEEADRQFRLYLQLSPEGRHAEEARESLLKQVSDAPKLPELSQLESSSSLHAVEVDRLPSRTTQ
jgi:Tfp pilus assembly protein PilF